ncbi:MAG: aminotransferase class I and II [Gemmatimonadota bacterium]|nr:aminotransferase class I and II [Gemmatimonadota bacterium]
MNQTLPRLRAARYVQPLREGGSLPAVVDTDGGLYVVKFRGAGQGPKALAAEILVGVIARALGLPVPDLALVDVPPPFGRSEPDPEIQDVLRRSHGINVGLRYLDGAFNYDAKAAEDLVSPELAAWIVWLDAFTTNPDRTHRNPNLLIWQRTPWLIDHGAALYAHHDWAGVDDARVRSPFPLIRHHVLLRRIGDLERADADAMRVLTAGAIRGLVGTVPDELLVEEETGGATPVEARQRYVNYLVRRLEEPREFVSAATEAREQLLREPPRAFGARR